VNSFDPNKDYYTVLGVSVQAGRREIRRAYLNQARRLHPDRGGADHAMKLLNEAYSVLGDPQLRLQYDRNRFAEERLFEEGIPLTPGSRGGTLRVPARDGRTMVLLAGSAGCFGFAMILLGAADGEVNSPEGAGGWLIRALSLLLLGIAVVLLNSAMRKGSAMSMGRVLAFLGGWQVIIQGVFWALAFDAAVLAIMMAYVG
jgi:hypothetical protein